MNKFETPYAIIGSSALKPGYDKNIIEFPELRDCNPLDSSKRRTALHGFADVLLGRAKRMPMIQDLLYGSVAGKSFGKVKSWQTILAGICFFAVALASIYIGR